MSTGNKLDTRYLLHIVLNPNCIIRNLNIKDMLNNDNYLPIYIDIIQFVQENLYENCLNKCFVKDRMLEESMWFIEGTIGDYSSLKIVYRHFYKLLFLVNLILNNYEEYKEIRFIPTIPPNVMNRIYSCGGNKNEWFCMKDTNLGYFTDKFNSENTTGNLWKYTVLGTVLSEFPKSSNLLNRDQFSNTITHLSQDVIMEAEAMGLYLLMKNNVLTVFQKSNIDTIGMKGA